MKKELIGCASEEKVVLAFKLITFDKMSSKIKNNIGGSMSVKISSIQVDFIMQVIFFQFFLKNIQSLL